MQWHRIDDPDHPPPKDGTWILVYEKSEYGPEHYVVSWKPWVDRRRGVSGENWETMPMGPDGHDTYSPEPSHWSPLKPPKE